jgi:hypothetical protein
VALPHLGANIDHCDQRVQHHFERSEKHHIAARRCIISFGLGFSFYQAHAHCALWEKYYLFFTLPEFVTPL